MLDRILSGPSERFLSVLPVTVCVCVCVCVSAGLVSVVYYIDNNVTNPYQLWQTMGSPDFPTAQQFRRLRSVQVNSSTCSESR